MKNKNKGFTLVELMISFSLATVVIIYLFNVLIILKNLYVDDGIKTKLLINQTNLLNSIESVMAQNEVSGISSCGTGCISIDNGGSHTLTYSKDAATITFDNHTFKLTEGSEIGDMQIKNTAVAGAALTASSYDSILEVTIPVTHKSVDGDFGLHFVFPYNASTISVTAT
ncbi:MAG: prepilin-type N-terminal cleavage/methylation domain-containing protein [Bacilli bacterium]|nr:prepilin-type N-terminal cleavage/methylation domain-containing protein [Bacilli bacterium]